MRIAKFLIILGLAFLIASYVPAPSSSHGNLVSGDRYHCFVVKVTNNLYVDVSGAENRNFSLYILDYNDTLIFLTDGSLENTEPLFSWENIQQFSGVLSLPEPGWYGVIITSSISDPSFNMRYDLYLTHATPYFTPFLLFVLLETLGGILLLYRKYK